MKTFNTVVSIVLLVAVAFLFIREFSGSPTDKSGTPGKKEMTEALEDQEFGGVRIAYVNSDSLVKKYDLHKELKSQLEEKAKNLEADLANKSQVFQENVAVLQQQAGRLSQEELQAAQLDLQQTQQQLQVYADEKTRDLAREERKLDSLLMLDMDQVLEDVRGEYDLDYVFSYSRQSSLLGVNDAYNITDIVVERLNEINRRKKEEKAKKE